ncbi:protein EURL-like [Patiria miniata]|uniref:Uncharacterized protein n=1 Tax=Patiria miniata TaxID=46514 RepID=A0A914AR97_PATMI|nr:protein EURL-like [Patiria miniata]XP_038066178.1 protein EURL-like [Patiria miniata]
MSVTTQTPPTQEDADDSFVSINLESSESCGICGLDTGEQLASSCKLCHLSSTRQPVQKGFNKIPDVLHAGIAAHESCLAKSHQVLAQAGRRPYQHSPLPHRRGISVPSDFPTLGLQDTIGDKLQWIINYAKNEDLRNRQNLLQVHSNPCTRSSSPVIFRALTEDALLRRHSENSLDTSFVELRKSYSRYLYGTSSITKSHSDDNVGCKTGSCPTISVDSNPEPKTDTPVPYVGNVKGQTVPPRKAPLQSARQDSTSPIRQSKVHELTDNNNESKFSEGSKSDSLTVPDAEKEKVTQDTRFESQRWSNKQKMDRQQLNSMSGAQIKAVVSRLEGLIKDISVELVELLQERDSLGQEVKVRNLTIQKLVKMKHSQQDAPIKTTGAGNI